MTTTRTLYARPSFRAPGRWDRGLVATMQADTRRLNHARVEGAPDPDPNPLSEVEG